MGYKSLMNLCLDVFHQFCKFSTIILLIFASVVFFLFSPFRSSIEYIKLSYFILHFFSVFFSSYLSLHASFCIFSSNVLKVHWPSFLPYNPSTEFLIWGIIIFYFPVEIFYLIFYLVSVVIFKLHLIILISRAAVILFLLSTV